MYSGCLSQNPAACLVAPRPSGCQGSAGRYWPPSWALRLGVKHILVACTASGLHVRRMSSVRPARRAACHRCHTPAADRRARSYCRCRRSPRLTAPMWVPVPALACRGHSVWVPPSLAVEPQGSQVMSQGLSRRRCSLGHRWVGVRLRAVRRRPGLVRRDPHRCILRSMLFTDEMFEQVGGGPELGVTSSFPSKIIALVIETI